MSVERTEHENKYDRQLRLWGGHGQLALETAKICCLGSGPSASETLKNLVLPNVQNFTIVDDVIVTESDTGNNFFVDEDAIGKPRCQAVCELLMEMNPVHGQFVVQNPNELIEKNIKFVNDFTIVIACCLPKGSLLTLAEHCKKQALPLVIVQAYGLIGYVRLQTPEHTIIESHYDNDRTDLYIHPDQTRNFPELAAFINAFNLSNDVEYFKHAHTPYVAVLGQHIKRWQAEHEGKMPTTFNEKKEFKTQIQKSARRDPSTGEIEENFVEGHLNAYRCYDKPTLDSLTHKTVYDYRADINSLKTTDAQDPSLEFWVLCQALQRFIAQTDAGLVPCSTNIPDMTSLPEYYITLKEIYATRAANDLAAVTKHVQNILREINRTTPIAEDHIAHFVKNCRGLRVVRTRSLAEEEDSKTFLTDNINELYDEWRDVAIDESVPPEDRPPVPPRLITWYFAMRAIQDFEKKHNRYPGTGDGAEYTNDVSELVMIQMETMMRLGINQPPATECLEELVRCGGTEIHNIAALVGGIGAQVTLKVLTKQYVPMNNTFIFDGIFGQSGMLTV